MDLIGFLNNLVFIANDIDMGRKGLATDGEEHAGRPGELYREAGKGAGENEQ
jgi:hypothetical protein